MYYKPDHFELHEVLPPEIINEFWHYKDRLWLMFDNRAVITLEMLRKRYGKAAVNNWHWCGRFKNSGFRMWDCEEGAKLSQHKFARAFDVKFANALIDDFKRVKDEYLSKWGG